MKTRAYTIIEHDRYNLSIFINGGERAVIQYDPEALVAVRWIAFYDGESIGRSRYRAEAVCSVILKFEIEEEEKASV